MRIQSSLLLSLLATALCLGGPARASAPGGPMAQIKHTNERIDAVLKNKKGDDDPAARAEMKSIVNGFLDYEELARRGLAQHWEKISKAQRDDFVSLLRQLVEKNYEKQLKGNTQYTVSYKNEEITDGDAMVGTMVRVKTKGKSTDTMIDYKLKRQGEQWMVYDVITDDVSMVKNYRTQWNKIITTDGFDALVNKMRKRVKELDAGDGTSTSASAEPAPDAAAVKADVAAKPAKPSARAGGTKTARSK